MNKEFFDRYGRNGEKELLGKLANPNATPDTIDKALDHPDDTIRWQALDHSNVDEQNILKALGDSNIEIRKMAIEHHKVNETHISKALDDPDGNIN